MKKIVLCSMLFIISGSSFSQQTSSESTSNLQDYLNKSKKQKKTGRILLIGGAGLMVTSFLIPRGELESGGVCVGIWCDTKYKNDGIKTAFFILGGVSALGSIPIFIASGKNRRKAATIGLNMENSMQLNQQNRAYTSLPGLRLKVNL